MVGEIFVIKQKKNLQQKQEPNGLITHPALKIEILPISAGSAYFPVVLLLVVYHFLSQIYFLIYFSSFTFSCLLCSNLCHLCVIISCVCAPSQVLLYLIVPSPFLVCFLMFLSSLCSLFYWLVLLVLLCCYFGPNTQFRS